MQHALRNRALALTALAGGAVGVAYWSAPAGMPEEKFPAIPARASVPEPVTEPARAAPAPPSEIDQPRQVSLAIERALVAADPSQRETAFNILLPELLALDPAEAEALLQRHPERESRAELREQLARHWIVRDREAAVRWLHGLPDEDRHAAAVSAVRALSAHSSVQALELSDEFGVGRDDGSRDYLLQMWAAEDPEAAKQWVAAQAQ
jgi:hypothetical protein